MAVASVNEGMIGYKVCRNLDSRNKCTLQPIREVIPRRDCGFEANGQSQSVPQYRMPANKQQAYRDAFDIRIALVGSCRNRRQASKTQETGKGRETHGGSAIRARIGLLKERLGVGGEREKGSRCRQDPVWYSQEVKKRGRNSGGEREERVNAEEWLGPNKEERDRCIYSSWSC